MLDHANIISYYDNFEEEGVLMIEMEYADGGCVMSHLIIPQALNIFTFLCRLELWLNIYANGQILCLNRTFC